MLYPIECIIYFDLIYPLFFSRHYIEIRNMMLKHTKPETVLMIAQSDFFNFGHNEESILHSPLRGLVID